MIQTGKIVSYIQLFRESMRLFRTTKTLWVLGFISLLILPVSTLVSYAHNSLALTCTFLLAGFFLTIIYIITNAGLIYAIYQAHNKEKPGLAEAWRYGKSRLFQMLGLILLTAPAFLIMAFLDWLSASKAPDSPLLWLVVSSTAAFAASLFTFGVCAILIDNLRPAAAAWTGLLITLNNYFRMCLIFGIPFLIQILLILLIASILSTGLFGILLPTPLSVDFVTYQNLFRLPVIVMASWVIDLLLLPLTSGVPALAYFKFSREISYPALQKNRNTV